MKIPEEIHLQEEAEIHQLVTGEGGWIQEGNYQVSLDRSKLRLEYIKTYGFCFLSADFLFSLKDFIGERTLIDLMCGSGYISHELRFLGTKTIQVDDKSWKSDHWWEENNSKHSDLIVSNSIRYLRENPPSSYSVILVSWPYMNNLMFAIARTLRRQGFQGDLLYIGEDAYGCTADTRFFNSFQLEELSFQPLQWDGMHDRIHKVNVLGKKPEDTWQMF